MFRRLCSDKMNNENIILGGVEREVEIDESHLFKRKYNRGNLLSFQNIWIFGIFERGSKRVFVKRVDRRDSVTLLNIARCHILPSTTIYSDFWRGYSLLRNEYTVLSVNHRETFVRGENNVIHTNNIERTWRTLKNQIRGISVENVDEHLNLFMFRKNFLVGSFFENFNFMLKIIFE